MRDNLLRVFYLLPVRVRLYVGFFWKLKYFPNFNNPVTFNEKVNYRKLYWTNNKFIDYSDKIKSKEIVGDIIGKQYIIPNIAVLDKLQISNLRNAIDSKNKIVVKCNHDSGNVFFLDENSNEDELKSVCNNINNLLKFDFGKKVHETWYSKIDRKVLIENNLNNLMDGDILDYKFHVFNDNCNKVNPKIVLQVDFDRFGNHTRSYFSEELVYLPFSNDHASIITAISPPLNYELMVSFAKRLSREFSYCRVDFYNIDGHIFFGELTFAHGSGFLQFNSKMFDEWKGKLWKGNIAN
ncbi:ATP-grasp fold amidoligase family protein [Vibrio cyclitrophicus]